MLEWFSGAVASAKAMKDITQSLITIRDAELVKSKVFDLTSNLMDLQQRLMDAQMEQMNLIDELRRTREELDSLKSKGVALDGYQLHRFERGGYAYRAKDQDGAEAPEHYLCSNCFEQGQKATLQSDAGYGWTGYRCPRCHTVIEAEHRDTPGPLVF